MSENHYTPSVILPGIGQSKVNLVDKDGQRIKSAWPLDIDGEAIMGELKAPLMKMMLFRKDAGFSDKMQKILGDILEPIAVNNDGTMKNTVSVVKYPQSLEKCSDNEKRYIYKVVPLQGLAQVIGESNLYFFAYNSFGEPYNTAAELDEFIQKVKAETGSDKVNLVPVSLGGVLCTAYLDAYGDKNDIDRVMYFVAALEGSMLVSDIMKKNLKTDEILPIIELIGNAKTAEMLGGLLKMLPPEVPANLIGKACDALLSKTVINCPSIWSVLPPSEYPELADKFLSDEEHRVLREKTDRFYAAQSHIRDIIDYQKAKGVEFFGVVGYGRQLFRLSASDTLSSDSIINTASSSLGAVCAPLGRTLQESDYEGSDRLCRNEEHNHISPENILDAAYGYMPETTWYFYDQQHDATAYNDKALEIAKRVLSDRTFTDIYSSPELPQFGTAQDNRK